MTKSLPPTRLRQTATRPSTDVQNPIAPSWVVEFARYVRLGLALTLIGVALIGLTSCSSPSANWKALQPDQPSVAAEVANLILEKQPEAIAQVTVWDISLPKSKEGDDSLSVLNFSGVPELCGRAGCLYAIVASQNGTPTLMLNTYLNPALPPHTPLFSISQQPDYPTPFPCFTVRQVKTATTLQQLELCPAGDQYVATAGTVTNITQK